MKHLMTLLALVVAVTAGAQSEYCGLGTYWDEQMQKCLVANGGDSNFDGCIYLEDLLALLSGFGTCDTGSCGIPIVYDDYVYETIQIGEQCWFAENLKTRHYANGDIIPVVYEDSLWAEANSGASCWLRNDSVIHHWNGRGMFYNHYAVTDDRGLCPVGWHVPSYNEFSTLFDVVGSDSSAVFLRSTMIRDYCWDAGLNPGWNTDFSMTAYDTFDFGMLASSYRHFNGAWPHPCNFGYDGFLWTSSTSYPNSPYFVYIHNTYTNAVLINDWSGAGPERGIPVRCVKD